MARENDSLATTLLRGLVRDREMDQALLLEDRLLLFVWDGRIELPLLADGAEFQGLDTQAAAFGFLELLELLGGHEARLFGVAVLGIVGW